MMLCGPLTHPHSMKTPVQHAIEASKKKHKSKRNMLCSTRGDVEVNVKVRSDRDESKCNNTKRLTAKHTLATNPIPHNPKPQHPALYSPNTHIWYSSLHNTYTHAPDNPRTYLQTSPHVHVRLSSYTSCKTSSHHCLPHPIHRPPSTT